VVFVRKEEGRGQEPLSGQPVQIHAGDKNRLALATTLAQNRALMATPSSTDSLADSFRQSKRELGLMLGAWVGFAAWTTIAGAVLGFHEAGESVATVFGMPRWVVVTVALPWVVANGFVIWFATRFMQDTDLGGPKGERGSGDA